MIERLERMLFYLVILDGFRTPKYLLASLLFPNIENKLNLIFILDGFRTSKYRYFQTYKIN